MAAQSQSIVAEPPQASFGWKSLKASDVGQIANTMKMRGYAVLDGLVSEEDVSDACEVANRLVDGKNSESVVRGGQEGLSGYILSRLHGELRPFFCELFQAISGMPPRSTRIQQSSRFLAGESQNDLSGYYHFDSYIIGLVVPILLPEPGMGGEFVMSPNARSLHQPYVLNACQKAIYDTRFMQKILARRLANGRARLTRVPMKTGRAYLFNGYTSLHSNEYCIGGQRRFTVVFHFGNPYDGSRLHRVGRQVSRRYHSLIEALGV